MGPSSKQANGNDPTPQRKYSRSGSRKLWTATVGGLALIMVAAMAVDLVARMLERVGEGAGDTPGASAARPGSAGTSAAASQATHRHPAPPVSGGSTAKTAGKAQPSARPKIPAGGPNAYAGAHLWLPPQSERGALITYSVRVQKGLPYDADATARFIQSVLSDRRSWGRSGDWRIKLVPTTAHAEVRVYLATWTTTDRLCAPLDTGGKVSCFNKHRVVLNADRWAYGAASYGHDLIGYRRNLVNHEFGHSLGHGHVTCPGKGKLGPIMMQQTKGLHGCRANPWPYPKA